MRIGIFGGDSPDRTIDTVIDDAREVEAQGFASYCLPQIFGVDAITVLSVVGREVPRIELATGVVPTYPRHPMMLAAQALTAQQITGNRFVLGIGLSHQIVIEGMLGMSFEKPVRHMREYLAILMPALRGEAVDAAGETLTFRGQVTVAQASPPPVLVAALGPLMLREAGATADGTVTWMTGPATLEGYIVPTINEAAQAAGRPAPRVAAALPVCVTDDPAAAREKAAADFLVYGFLPSYRAMLDREGAEGPADVAIVGSANEVSDRIRALGASGVTDFIATEFGSRADRESTREVLRSLL